jgi:hypothetical protein
MEDVQMFRQLLQKYKHPLYPELIRIPHLLPSQTMLSLQEQGYLLAREVFEGPASAARWADHRERYDDRWRPGRV